MSPILMAAGAAAKSAPSWLGPVAGIAGNLLGGLFGDKGQQSANEANLRIARENREWQERMSSTAYQRAAKDLDAAGLNRILALGNSASTPSGNIATMQNENTGRAAAANQAAHSAMSLRLQNEQAKLLGAQANNIATDTRLKQATIGKTGAETRNLGKLFDQIDANIQNLVANTNLTTARGGREAAISAMYDMIPDVIVTMQDVLGLSDDTVDRLLKYFYDRRNQQNEGR